MKNNNYLCILLLLVPASCYSTETTDVVSTQQSIKYNSISAGMSYKRTNFKITNLNHFNQATFEAFNYSPVIELTIAGGKKMLDHGKLSVAYTVGYSSFTVNKQVVNDNVIDFDTSVDGEYAYFMPTLSYAYAFGEKVYGEQPDSSLAIGIGIGLGTLKAKGMVVYEGYNDNAVEPYSFRDTMEFGELFVRYYYKGLLVEYKNISMTDGILPVEDLNVVEEKTLSIKYMALF